MIQHRDDFLELCEHPEVTQESLISLLRHTLKGNALSRYRSLIRDGKNWAELDETFTKFSLTEASRERNSSRLESLKFKEFKTEDNDNDEALLALVRKIEELVPLSARKDNDEMMKCKHLLRATKHFEWSKKAKGRLRMPYEFMELCEEM